MNGQELNELATQYLTDKDYENALKYYLEASDQGNFYAMYNLACMYYFGDGVEKNESTSLEWFERAARHGDPEGANRAGVMYENGIGTGRDLKKAFAYYTESAEEHSLSGMANLGLCYLEGKGTAADVSSGLDWMEKASAGGNGIASLTMGDYYRDGNYVEKNYVTARKYYERGQKQKYAPAMIRLAELYEKGLGAAVDGEKGRMLRKLAEETADSEQED